MAIGHREGRLYFLSAKAKESLKIDDQVLNTVSTEKMTQCTDDSMSQYKLWHLRLGHLGTQNLQRMSRLVDGLQDVDLTPSTPNICEGCLYGRQCQQPFEDSETQRLLLELVHSDLLGPIRTPTLKGSRYVLTFIDHYSHFPKYYYFKNKDGVTV